MNWGGNNYYTLFAFERKYQSHKQLESKFPSFLNKSLPAFNGLNAGKMNKLHLQKITDIHLHSHLMGEAEPNSDIKYVYIFGCIAFFILLIACDEL